MSFEYVEAGDTPCDHGYTYVNANKKSDRGTAGICECAKKGEGLGDQKQCEEMHKNNNTIYLSSDDEESTESESDDAYSTESESEDESEDDEKHPPAPPREGARYRSYELDKNGNPVWDSEGSRRFVIENGKVVRAEKLR